MSLIISLSEANSERFVTTLEITNFNVGITDENTIDNSIEFVEITNTSDYPAQMDDHVVVGFNSGETSCISINLYGELQPGETFKIGDPLVAGIDHEIQLDRVGDCGDGNNQFSDQEGALAIYMGDNSSIGTGFALGNYETDRKDLVEYSYNLSASSTEALKKSDVVMGSFAAYPNPLAQEGLWLEFPAAEQRGEAKAYIYDINGRLVAEKTFSVETAGSKHNWNLEHSNWSNGMYMLIIQGEKTKQKFKLFKQ